MSNLYLNTKSLLERIDEDYCQAVEDGKKYKDMGMTVLADMALGKCLALQTVLSELETILVNHVLSNKDQPIPKYRPVSGEL